MTETTMDYAKVTQYLKEEHKCDKILIDFNSLEGKMLIHRYYLHPDGSGKWGKQVQSYDYSDFECIIKKLKMTEPQYKKWFKNWHKKENRKYYPIYDEWFQPHFRWNPFDYRNDWQPEWLREYMYGWSGVGYAWECWSYLMRDKKYSYQLPNAFWLELNGSR